jgi:hypothetical protein
MSRMVVEIPVEVWEFTYQDCERIASLHRETLRLMNENARLKAEVERLRKAGEWQPIETAPKDGITETLVMDCGHVYIGIFDKNGFCEDLHCAGLDPTHWMPLPNPPAAKDGKPTP